jgi:hypothetical protein
MKKADEEMRIIAESADEFRNKVLALLTIIKELEKDAPPEGKESVREMTDNDLFEQLSILNREVEDQYTALKVRIAGVEEKNEVTRTGTPSDNADPPPKIDEIKKNIEKYYAYAGKFIEPYLQNLTTREAEDQQPKSKSPGKFMGKLAVGLGQTVQNSAGNVSGIAGNVDFTGRYRVSSNTSVSGGIRYQEEIIRTPFASIRADAGIQNTFKNKMRLNVGVGLNNYNDKQANNNDFNVYNASVNLFAPLGRRSHIRGHLSRGSRSYKQNNNNDFASTRYQLSLALSQDQTSETNLFIRGNFQSSLLDYLNFRQLNPGLIYTKRRDPARHFTTLIDLNQFEYSGEAADNNYSRGRLDLKWMRKRENRSSNSVLGLIGKVYTNNTRLNYIRGNLAFGSSENDLSRGRLKSNTFRATYTYYLEQPDNLLDYLDMRFDRLIRGRGAFFNFNMFGRLYNSYNSDIDVYQTLDMFLTAGPVIRNREPGTALSYNFRLGPVVGTHMLIGSEYEFWENSGTSFRLGISLQGYMNIKKASLRLMCSYEKQVLVTSEYDIDYTTGDLIVGDTYYREPNTFQVYIDFRLPVGKAWDIFVNVDYYNLKTDVREDTDISPNVRNMRQRIAGGAVYRFVL